MVAAGFDFVVVLLAFQMHQVEFVNKAVALQEIEGAIDGGAVDGGLALAGESEERGGVQMLVGALDDFEEDAALGGDAHALTCKFLEERTSFEGAVGLAEGGIRRLVVGAGGTGFGGDYSARMDFEGQTLR